MLRVVDWQTYEKGRSKEIHNGLAWVAVPADLNSLGYGRLMTHHLGSAHLGVWLALLELSAGLPLAKRGMICSETGREYTSDDLSVKLRIPSEIIDEAIPRLVEIGWLSNGLTLEETGGTFPPLEETAANGGPLEETGGNVRQLPAVCGNVKPDNNNNKNTNTTSTKDSLSLERARGYWEEFKRLYPQGRLDEHFAAQMWVSRNEDAEAILAGLRLAVATDEWKRERGRFVPKASRFIADGLYLSFKPVEEKPREPDFDISKYE